MNAIGIIAEYNPLHYGHIYQMKEASRLAGRDVVAVAMSGNYVQRGEPAILDKWERAGLALKCGADIVLEIPTLYCLSDAGQYARAGVKTLEALGCVDTLGFGSECGDKDRLIRIANNLRSNSDELKTLINTYSRDGLNYPAARAKAYTELFPERTGDADILSEPNDILAIEYLGYCDTMDAVAVKRTGAGYGDSVDADRIYQSASGIRELVKGGGDAAPYVPAEVSALISESRLTDPDDWFEFIRYAVMSHSPEEIECCPSGGEGLGFRLRDAAYKAHSYKELISSAKSKRYTYTRIARLVMQLLLGINRDAYADCNVSYIRVLAMNSRGRELLSQAVKSGACRLPVVSRLGSDIGELDEKGRKLLELDAHAADIYNLITGRDIYERSDYRMHPAVY